MKRPILYPILWCALFNFLFGFTSYGQNSKSSASKQNSVNVRDSKKQVYIDVAGKCYNENTPRHTAVYWKNGQPVEITDRQSDAEATSMTVVDNDVFLPGNIGG